MTKRTTTWVRISGYPYDVSARGQVRRSEPGPSTQPGKVLRPFFNKKGYARVALYDDGKRKHRLVHHLVAEAFIGPRPDGMECRHLDGNKTNNSALNLRWGTSAENSQDAIRHGTFVAVAGERNGRAKLTNDQVLQIRADDRSCSVLAQHYGVSSQTISNVKRGLCYSAA